MKTIKLFLIEPFDRSLLPVRASKLREWWEQDDKTKNHAKFCHPLTMANHLGFYILAPATFTIEWDGDLSHDANLELHQSSSHAVVDTHAARGSFTLQTQFVPVTDEGDFIYIKSIPNVRRPYCIMDAIIEAWWNPAHFGIVGLCNGPGKFMIKMGEPIAHMFILNDKGAESNLIVAGSDNDVLQRKEFLAKRLNYTQRQLDYLRGLFPDETKATKHYFGFRGTSPNKVKPIL